MATNLQIRFQQYDFYRHHYLILLFRCCYTCCIFGSSDGQISITATGGTNSYSHWFNQIIKKFTNIRTLTDISVGTYTVDVTDTLNTSVSKSFVVTTIVIRFLYNSIVCRISSFSIQCVKWRNSFGCVWWFSIHFCMDKNK